MINTNKLKGRMREKGITQADVAKYLELAQPTVNQKLNNLRSLSLEEAHKLAQLLEISSDDFPNYFFEN